MAAVSPTGVVDAVLLLGERVSKPSSRSRVDGVEVARHTPSSRRRVAGASWDQEPHTFRGGLLRSEPSLGDACPSRRSWWPCTRRRTADSTTCQTGYARGAVARVSFWGCGQRIEAFITAKQQAFSPSPSRRRSWRRVYVVCEYAPRGDAHA